jgi:hypothetical protein
MLARFLHNPGSGLPGSRPRHEFDAAAIHRECLLGSSTRRGRGGGIRSPPQRFQRVAPAFPATTMVAVIVTAPETQLCCAVPAALSVLRSRAAPMTAIHLHVAADAALASFCALPRGGGSNASSTSTPSRAASAVGLAQGPVEPSRASSQKPPRARCFNRPPRHCGPCMRARRTARDRLGSNNDAHRALRGLCAFLLLTSAIA